MQEPSTWATPADSRPKARQARAAQDIGAGIGSPRRQRGPHRQPGGGPLLTSRRGPWQQADGGRQQKQLGNQQVEAVALHLAAVKHGVADRVEFTASDLFAAVATERQFDLVVSNPPYVTTAEMAKLPLDVRDHEPHLALAGGPEGTDVIARLISQSAERLTQGGKLLIEISPQIEPKVRALVEADGRLELGATIKDLAGMARVIQATMR